MVKTDEQQPGVLSCIHNVSHTPSQEFQGIIQVLTTRELIIINKNLM
jgi:hypothetical protein